MAIVLSDRNVFFALHLRAADKRKLRWNAMRSEISMSELGARLIAEGLKSMPEPPDTQPKEVSLEVPPPKEPKHV